MWRRERARTPLRESGVHIWLCGIVCVAAGEKERGRRRGRGGGGEKERNKQPFVKTTRQAQYTNRWGKFRLQKRSRHRPLQENQRGSQLGSLYYDNIIRTHTLPGQTEGLKGCVRYGRIGRRCVRCMRYGWIGGRREKVRGEYRFSSLVKQNKRGKNYAVFCFAGFFF